MNRRDAQKDLQKIRQDLALSRKQISIESEKERKRQTREKIELGGLIVKAGIKDLNRSEILGILLEAKQAIERDGSKSKRDHWLEIGKAEFEKKQLSLSEKTNKPKK